MKAAATLFCILFSREVKTGIAWQYPYWQRAHFLFWYSCQNRYCVTVSKMTNHRIFYFFNAVFSNFNSVINYFQSEKAHRKFWKTLRRSFSGAGPAGAAFINPTQFVYKIFRVRTQQLVVPNICFVHQINWHTKRE